MPPCTRCTSCVAGKFKASIGPEACTQCTAGKVSTATAATTDVCRGCSADTYSSTDTTECLACPSNTVSEPSSAEQSDCKCDKGYTGPDGGPCTACVAGKFKGDKGQATCTACPADSYQPDTDAHECTKCRPHSSTVGLTGSTSASLCICNSGYYFETASSLCLACPAHSSSSPGLTSASSCVCNSNYYMVLANTVYTCVSCPLNSVGPVASERCVGLNPIP